MPDVIILKEMQGFVIQPVYYINGAYNYVHLEISFNALYNTLLIRMCSLT